MCFLLLALQRFGMRTIEAVVLVLVGTIGVCYFIEIFVLPQTVPSFREMGHSLLTPGFRKVGMAYVAIGIIGATVMPHNLYLHSALVQSRKLGKDEHSVRSAIKFNTIDSVLALAVAFFVNAAILFWRRWSFTAKRASPFQVDKSCISAATPIGFASLISLSLRCWARRRRAFCLPCAAGQRPEQHHHGHAGRAGRDGRVHALAPGAVGSPADHARAGNSAGGAHHRDSWQRKRQRSVDAQPGGAGAAIAVRDVPAAAFHQFAHAYGHWKSGWFLLVAGWASALLITAMDLYGLPDSLKSAWQVITGG